MKTVCPQGRMGSNPILSARFVEKQNELIIIIIQVIGEVPKRLKGLPWKGSRSLIAARGFKSLLLRSFLKKERKKFLTKRKSYGKLEKLLKRTNVEEV